MLKSLKQCQVTDVMAEVTHKNVKVLRCVLTLILLECPIDSDLQQHTHITNSLEQLLLVCLQQGETLWRFTIAKQLV